MVRSSRRTAALALWLAGAAASLLAPAWGCSKTAASVQPVAPVVIGVSLGLSGGLSSFSAPLQNATKVAELQVNAVGGLFGRPISFSIKDDSSDEGKTVQGVAQSFVDEGAVALLGPLGSSQVVAMLDIATQHHVIVLSSSATSTDLTGPAGDNDRYFFRTTPADDLQGQVVAIFAARGPAGIGGTTSDGGVVAPACARMAIVYIDNSYGSAMTAVVARYHTSHGGTVLPPIKVPAKAQSSYQTEIGQMMKLHPDCQALIAYDATGVQYLSDLKAAREASPSDLPGSFFVIGTDGLYTKGFLVNGRIDKTDAGAGTIVEGTYGTNPDTNPGARQEYREFKNLYLSQFALESGEDDLAPYTANQFDAAMLIVLAMHQAWGGATTGDPVKLRDALFAVSKGGSKYGPAQLDEAILAINRGEDIDYKGASGEVDLQPNGNVKSDFIVWKVVNGKFVTIGHINEAELEQ
jgi:ABC-type branched-subunit amino acid transport system substrate-binding protein